MMILPILQILESDDNTYIADGSPYLVSTSNPRQKHQ